jgi:hypothetical protein
MPMIFRNLAPVCGGEAPCALSPSTEPAGQVRRATRCGPTHVSQQRGTGARREHSQRHRDRRHHLARTLSRRIVARHRDRHRSSLPPLRVAWKGASPRDRLRGSPCHSPRRRATIASPRHRLLFRLRVRLDSAPSKALRCRPRRGIPLNPPSFRHGGAAGCPQRAAAAPSPPGLCRLVFGGQAARPPTRRLGAADLVGPEPGPAVWAGAPARGPG